MNHHDDDSRMEAIAFSLMTDRLEEDDARLPVADIEIRFPFTTEGKRAAITISRMLRSFDIAARAEETFPELGRETVRGFTVHAEDVPNSMLCNLKDLLESPDVPETAFRLPARQGRPVMKIT